MTNKDAGLAPGAVTISESGLSNDGGTAAQAAAPDSAASEEDNEVMMANLERTRSKYDAKEEDELFDKVSKAYVRNLDKVLKRKTLD